MFWTTTILPVDTVFGVPNMGRTVHTHEFSLQTQEILQLAFERLVARRKLTERAGKPQATNEGLTPVPCFPRKGNKFCFSGLMNAPTSPTLSYTVHGEDRTSCAVNSPRRCTELRGHSLLHTTSISKYILLFPNRIMRRHSRRPLTLINSESFLW